MELKPFQMTPVQKLERIQELSENCVAIAKQLGVNLSELRELGCTTTLEYEFNKVELKVSYNPLKGIDSKIRTRRQGPFELDDDDSGITPPNDGDALG